MGTFSLDEQLEHKPESAGERMAARDLEAADWPVVVPPQVKHVRIFGGLARAENFKDDGAEIWALNGIIKTWMPRVDRLFNLHTWDRLMAYKYKFTELDWLREHPHTPFYTMDVWPISNDVNQHLFPCKLMMYDFPRGRYHCGSFDWLIAFAIRMGAERIDLHGIGMVLEPGEPISARACLEYWCGLAEGRGITVTAAEDCDLFYFYHLVKSNLIYSVDDTPIYEDRRDKARKGAPYAL